MKKTKALVLLSGGLDSMLACRVLMEQGIEVTAISFISHFFNSEKAKIAVESLGIELIEYNFKNEHFKIVKNPRHGYGKNFNPCIDCHGLMIKIAGDIMKKDGYDFVATGEVLGQRPMSQNIKSLKLVEQYAGIEGCLVRPLSARLLEKTKPEESGVVDREKLLDINGRTRTRQVELAKKYGIKVYPSPGGGCLLTDPAYSNKLVELFKNWPQASGADTELIQLGRVFWMNDENKKILLVIARDKNESEKLKIISQPNDVLINLEEDVPGPTSLLRGLNYIKNQGSYDLNIPEEFKKENIKHNHSSEAGLLEEAIKITGQYAVKARGKKIKFLVKII